MSGGSADPKAKKPIRPGASGEYMDISVFNPPENYMAEEGMLFWPTIQEQIRLVKTRQEQIGRVLSFYKGSERDYETLKNESDILFAVIHTLCGVRDLCNNNPVHADAST